MSVRSELSRSVFFEELGLGLRFDVVELPNEWSEEASEVATVKDALSVGRNRAFWLRVAEYVGIPTRHVLSYGLWEYQTGVLGKLLNDKLLVEGVMETYGGSEAPAIAAIRASIDDWRLTHSELTRYTTPSAFVEQTVRNSTLGSAFRCVEGSRATFPVRNVVQNGEYRGSLFAIASRWLADHGIDDIDAFVWQGCSNCLLQSTLPSVKKAYFELRDIEIPFSQSPTLKPITWKALVGTCYAAAATVIGATAIAAGNALARENYPSLMLLATGVTHALVFVSLIPILDRLGGSYGIEQRPVRPRSEPNADKADVESGTLPHSEAVSTGAAPHGYVVAKNSPVFHRTDCKRVAKNLRTNCIRYATRDEAIQAGKRPCQECSP